jgi:site-specific recombinase XerD
MVDIVLAASGLPAVPGPADDDLRRATIGWLLAQKSIHTRDAYRRDVLGIGTGGTPAKMPVPAWLPWCEQNGVDPLAARRSHADLYARAIEAAGQSPATWARKISAVSSWYDYLADEGIADANPARKASRPDIDRDVSPAVGLSEAELNLLLDQAETDGPRSAALISVLYFGAFRVGSVLRANIGDLGWDEGDRTLRLVLKGGKERRAVLEGEAGAALEAYLATRGDPDPGEPLFASSAGGRLGEPYCWRLVRRLARQAGIRAWAQLNPHSLRHAHATHARDEGVALDVVQDTLGHKDQRTTQRYDRARFRRRRRSGTVLSDRRRRAREDRDD